MPITTKQPPLSKAFQKGFILALKVHTDQSYSEMVDSLATLVEQVNESETKVPVPSITTAKNWCAEHLTAGIFFAACCCLFICIGYNANVFIKRQSTQKVSNHPPTRRECRQTTQDHDPCEDVQL